jgi:hypothetical protein
LAAGDDDVLAGGEHRLRQAVTFQHAARCHLAVPDRFFAVSADDAQVDEGMGIDELELGNAAVDGDLLVVVVVGGDAVVGLRGHG